MATEIRNLVVYECHLNARDLSCNKKLSNTLYYRSQDQGTGYGANIVGTSLATFTDNLLSGWTNTVPDYMTKYLSINYEMVDATVLSIVGHGYNTALIGVAGVTIAGTTTVITTATDHGFSDGDTVYFSDVTTPVSLNGIQYNITVIDSTHFSLPVTYVGAYTGIGKVQLANKQQQFQYGDKQVTPNSTLGEVAGDSLPSYCTVSMRRLNSGVGRNWKSRISLGTIGESQQIDGKLTTTALTNFTNAGAQLAAYTFGTGLGGVSMLPFAVSKQIAFAQANPFTESASWTRPVTNFVPQPNLGSFVKRKPRLTAVIV